MKHAKIKAAEDEREQLEEEINSLRTDLRLARSNTKIYGEKERGKFWNHQISAILLKPSDCFVSWQSPFLKPSKTEGIFGSFFHNSKTKFLFLDSYL